jgi:TusA-related sulfurtransferase
MKDTEKMGDALDEYTQAQVLEAIADESEMTEEEIEAWADWWLAKENA